VKEKGKRRTSGKNHSSAMREVQEDIAPCQLHVAVHCRRNASGERQKPRFGPIPAAEQSPGGATGRHLITN
jgi:hypothetical protein